MEVLTGGALPAGLAASFLATRVSTQLLLRHHLGLWPTTKPTPTGLKAGAATAVEAASALSADARPPVGSAAPVPVSGAVQPSVGLGELARSAGLEGRLLVEAALHVSPEVKVTVDNNATETDVCVVSAPSYVRYVLLELLKNALRASAEHPGADKPPVHVAVGASSSSRSAVAVVRNRWSAAADPTALAHALARFAAPDATPATDADNSAAAAAPALWDRLTEQGSYMPTRAPLHGIGVGLGLSRAHAAYLGGALTVRAYGADAGSDAGVEAVLELPLGEGAVEHIPLQLLDK
jgi:hypothetical protein